MNVSLRQLEEAVGRGIISRVQLEEILGIPATAEDGVGDPPLPPSATAAEDGRRRQGTASDPDAAGPEAPAGMNAVTVAYYAGAVVVLFAFGWFLVERWEVLGADGVLAVTALYALIFAFASRFLARQGFAHASAISTLLVVGMVPLMTWSLLSLAGWWPDFESGARLRTGHDWLVAERSRWIPIEFATALAALIGIQRVRHPLLALPLAIAVHFAIVHSTVFLVDPPLIRWAERHMGVVAGTILLLGGYIDDRSRRGGKPDYAFWVYTTAFVLSLTNGIPLWGASGHWRHVLAPLALLLAAAALRLRRREFLVAAFIAAVWYLGFLSFEVFEDAIGFPVALATFGIGIILLAVVIQRRYPSLVRGGRSGWSELPGGMLGPAGLVLVAAAMFIAGITGESGRRARQRAIDAAERPISPPAQPPQRTATPDST